jgi:hypothetical protein
LRDEVHAYREEASQQNKLKEQREGSLVNATWCAAIAAAVAAILSLVSVLAFVWLTLKTDSTAQNAVMMSGNQLKVMEDQGRPWIEANASLSDPVTFSHWGNGRTILVRLNLFIKNFGDIPAVNVHISVPQIISYEDARRTTGIFRHPQEDSCSELTDSDDKNPIGGIAIFPSETKTISVAAYSWPGFPDGKPDWFYVIGCVDYTYRNGLHGQTGFRYRLSYKTNNLLVGIPFVEGAPLKNWDNAMGPAPLEAEMDSAGMFFSPDPDEGNYAR